jgi:DNA-binding winged helix-turn-helix (wHTH) protein
MAAVPAFEFGPFRLCRDSGELFRDGTRVSIQTQPARLLALLVTHAGEVVTREEIKAHLWSDTAVAYDQSINYCIRQIRIALGEYGASMVETLPRQGYRFAMPVEYPAAPWWSGNVSRRMRSMALPATAGVLVGLFIGATLGRPMTVITPSGALTATFGRIAARADSGWRHLRAHVAGELTCPYMQLLIPNSRATHRPS